MESPGGAYRGAQTAVENVTMIEFIFSSILPLFSRAELRGLARERSRTRGQVRNPSDPRLKNQTPTLRSSFPNPRFEIARRAAQRTGPGGDFPSERGIVSEALPD